MVCINYIFIPFDFYNYGSGFNICILHQNNIVLHWFIVHFEWTDEFLSIVKSYLVTSKFELEMFLFIFADITQ